MQIQDSLFNLKVWQVVPQTIRAVIDRLPAALGAIKNTSVVGYSILAIGVAAVVVLASAMFRRHQQVAASILPRAHGSQEYEEKGSFSRLYSAYVASAPSNLDKDLQPSQTTIPSFQEAVETIRLMQNEGRSHEQILQLIVGNDWHFDIFSQALTHVFGSMVPGEVQIESSAPPAASPRGYHVLKGEMANQYQAGAISACTRLAIGYLCGAGQIADLNCLQSIIGSNAYYGAEHLEPEVELSQVGVPFEKRDMQLYSSEVELFPLLEQRLQQFFFNPEENKALLIANGEAIAVRKVEGWIEFCDTHGCAQLTHEGNAAYVYVCRTEQEAMEYLSRKFVDNARALEYAEGVWYNIQSA